MRIASAFPLWLKYLIGLGFAGFVLPILAAADDSDLVFTLCVWLVFVWLALFPGKRPGFPRMFGVLTVVWVLASVAFLVVLSSDRLWHDFASDSLPAGREGLVRGMLTPYLILYPALTLTLWKRLGAFRPLVVATALYNVLCALLTHTHQHPASVWATALNILLDIAVATYLLLHFRAKLDPAAVTVARQPSATPPH